ncbi:MAG: SPOR domain-containing protein [Rubrivivax sp.]|jgi:cell division protein FtsN|nr:SPOR domain-containing protein [Rubrivivax sp.]
MRRQRGGFVLGVVAGLLVGLAVALAVALYITKTPVPFIDKVPQRTAEQDQAEAERNRSWDPNAPLAPRATPRVAAPGSATSPAAAASAPVPVATQPATPERDPAAILSGAATPGPAPGTPTAVATAPATQPFVFHVQVGAYSRPEDAEQQRAKMAMIGFEARLSEREQAGRTVYRVRIGPFETREEAEAVQTRLANVSIDARLVRVERN